MVTTNLFLESIFDRNSSAFTSEIGSKTTRFSHRHQKHQYCENHCFSYTKLLFFRFGAFKNRAQFAAKKGIKNNVAKRLEKIEF